MLQASYAGGASTRLAQSPLGRLARRGGCRPGRPAGRYRHCSNGPQIVLMVHSNQAYEVHHKNVSTSTTRSVTTLVIPGEVLHADVVTSTWSVTRSSPPHACCDAPAWDLARLQPCEGHKLHLRQRMASGTLPATPHTSSTLHPASWVTQAAIGCGCNRQFDLVHMNAQARPLTSCSRWR